MSDKHLKELQQSLMKLHEKKEDLFINVDTLYNTANQQVQSISKSQTSLSDKEALLTYLAKLLVLLSELNHSVLKCSETVAPPIPIEHSVKIEANHDAAEDGPMVSSDQDNNNSFIGTLKAICANVINNNGLDQNIVQPNNIHASPCSESDVLSSASTYCAHPLTKFRPPTEIPPDFDTTDLEKVKENMKYFSRKMGFDSEGFIQMTSQYDKGSVDYQFEEPVKEVAIRTPVDKVLLEIPLVYEAPTSNSNDLERPQKLNNEVPSKSTGAIKKQKVIEEEDLIQFDESSSSSDSCNKVTSWLEHNSQMEKHKSTGSENCGAIEKLSKLKRCDRNEEAREKARADMPDLRLVPVEPPLMIKNDLNSNVLQKVSKAEKPKVKDLNKDSAVYEIPPWNVPEVGAACVFSYIKSPSEFYLQILNDVNGSYLDEVSEKLDEKFTKTVCRFRTKQEASARLGNFCYGYIWGERKSWYRLQVLNWQLDSPTDEVEVFSVDYGFKCFTPYIYLRDLTPDLAHIPMLAVKCHFSMLFPPGSTYMNRDASWPIGTIQALHELANLIQDQSTAVPEDITMFEIIFAMQDGDSVGVDLVYYSEGNSIAELLIDSGLATEIRDDYAEHPELGEFLEDNDELENANNINEFLLGYDAKDEARICKFTRKDGSCYKGKNCKRDHIQPKDGYTTDKTAVFYAPINHLILPNKDVTIQVLITTFVDSCTYFVQMIRNPVQKENNMNFSMDKDISDLMDAMNHPKIIAKYAPFQILPSIGEIILAYHPIARQWMRAAVREVNRSGEETSIEVYSVDFGEEFLVNTKNIAMMREEFMHLPFQVVQIYLDNYQHRKGCDHNVARKFFAKHLAYKNFLAHIKTNDLPYKVSLMTFKRREIGPTLIREGLAEPRTVDIFISDDLDKRRNFDVE